MIAGVDPLIHQSVYASLASDCAIALCFSIMGTVGAHGCLSAAKAAEVDSSKRNLSSAEQQAVDAMQGHAGGKIRLDVEAKELVFGPLGE